MQLFGGQLDKRTRKQAEIVAAAITSIAKRGLDGTTFQVIGESLKMSRSNLLYYFDSREEIIEKCVQYVALTAQQITQTCVAQADSPEQKLAAIIEANFKWLDQHPEQASVMGLFYFICTYNQKYRLLHQSIRKVGQERLAACLKALPELSNLTPGKALELAERIQSLMVGRSIDWVTQNPRKSKEVIVKLTLGDVQSFIASQLS